MIKNWIVTGDTHGGMATISRIGNIQRNMSDCKPEETAIIILGDAGLNFYLNNTDKKYKKTLNNMGYHIYCVRGNHEQRPGLIDTYEMIVDDETQGPVWVEKDFPNIKFFADGGSYIINGYHTLVLGGAYSVDKWYRLARAGYSRDEAETADPKKCGWFKDECLTREEMELIGNWWNKEHFDFVLSHTCPLSWEPTDLFLGGIDQSTVDKSMEIWMDELKNKIDWQIWLFGHFHADRIERPCVEQMYMDYENLETIWNRWFRERTYEKEWWLPKSPYMEMWEVSDEGQEWLKGVKK